MADRTVAVRLRAEVGDYIAKMGAAARATQGVAAEGQQLGTKMGLISPKMAGIGMAAGAMATLTVSKFADFDAAMSRAEAATGETGTAMESLRQAAIKAGQDTKYSAGEAADAITNLAKAGVSTKDILGGALKGAMDLAAAGGMEVADAAEAAADAMTMFKLGGDEVTHVADLLAAGAGKASGDVSDLLYALKQGGSVAEQFGIDIEDTTGFLSAFAASGVKGSDAGTSFKTMLLHLANPSKTAAGAMKELGIEAYDAQGKFVGLSELAGQLQASLSDLTQEDRNAAMAQIFGTDGIRAANILYKEGAAGIQKWRSAVDDTGYAAETAATMTDNLRGDVERLTSSLDSLFIKAGEGTDGPLRELVQDLTAVADAVNQVDETMKLATDGVGLFTSLPSLLGTAWRKLKEGPFHHDEEVDWLAVAADRADRAITNMSKGALPASQKIFDLAQAEAAAAESAADAAMEQKRLNNEWLASIDAAASAEDAAIGFEEALDGLTASTKKNGHSTDINTEKGRANARALADLRTSAVQVIKAMVEQGESQDKVAKKANKMADRMYDAARAAGFSKAEAKKLADALRAVPEKVKTQYTAPGLNSEKDGVADLKSAQKGVAKPVSTTFSAHGLSDSIKQTDKLLGILNKIDGMNARASVSMGGMGGMNQLGDVASGMSGGHGLMAATHGVGHPSAPFGARGPRWSTNKRNGMGMHDGADIGAPAGTPVYATRSGWVEDARGGWAGNHAILRVGPLKLTYAHLSRFGKSGLVAPGDVIGYVGSTGNSSGPHLHIQARINGGLVNPAGRLARGGKVRGPGTPTSDSIPAMLSDGEWVINAATSERMGDDWMAALNAGLLADGVGGYKKGGKAKSKKGKKKAKGPSVADVVEDTEWQYDMDKIDLNEKLSRLQGQLAKLKVGSAAWKDLSLSIHNIQKDLDKPAQESPSDSGSSSSSPYQQAMALFEHQINMGVAGFTTATDQLAQLNNVVATTQEEEWALAEKKHGLEQQIIAEQEAAAQVIEDAAKAAREQRDSYASQVASGMMGQLGMGQDNGGKKWGAGSVVADFNKRVGQAEQFAAGIQSLTARGLSREVVQQVVAAGPVAGMGMIKALQSMSDDQLVSVNEAQSRIGSVAAGMGAYLGNAFLGIAGDSTVRVDIGGSAPVVLQLDSRQVYEGQLELRRQMGGSYALVPR